MLLTLEKTVKIVKSAGAIFEKGFYGGKKVDLKGKKDLVTEYDVKIEEYLKKSFQNYGFSIIAEESERGVFGDSIIIDPIDGTTNFAHKVPHCCISVGVYKNEKPLFGVVYNPVLNECFTAEKGEGAYLNGVKIEVSKKNDFQRSLIATGFPYSSADNADDLEMVIQRLKNVLPKCQDIRRLGSAALDLCYVAQGVFEGFYEINLKAWDVAAGMIIVNEAGGTVSNDRNETYNMFGDKCIVATNGHIHQKLINCF